MKIHRIDHVGIVVNDLPAAKAFFLDFGVSSQYFVVDKTVTKLYRNVEENQTKAD
jgi:catechol 2,3-dioxygenase-like lactoylglutathione lyase family enzyme